MQLVKIQSDISYLSQAKSNSMDSFNKGIGKEYDTYLKCQSDL